MSLCNESPAQTSTSYDSALRALLAEQGVEAVDPSPAQNAALVELGQALFFDAELSGNRDISCATCHFPALSLGDNLSLPVGTGAVTPGALGPDRELGVGREFIPRNSPEVFNRGLSQWRSMFWDSRVEEDGNGGFISPAGAVLPEDLPNVLAVQAMFPVTSRDEMRGAEDDVDVFGDVNEMAQIPDDDLPAMWAALMDRLLAIEGYQDLFDAAYPDIAADELGFEHVATAIAAFEIDAFTFLDTAWDRYLAGDDAALTTEQKQGSLIFYGRAGCSTCHSGVLLTDQQHHNILVPQLGPGKAPDKPLDLGRARETGDERDRYRFRTPPLRNVVVSGPYMHNGAYVDLEQAILHHRTAALSLFTYNPLDHLAQEELIETVQGDFSQKFDILLTTDLNGPMLLTQRDVGLLINFLDSLTTPDLSERLDATVPDSVPSGLPVDGEFEDPDDEETERSLARRRR